MNNIRNRVQLIGNLGMDVELKSTEKGRQLAKVSIATRDVYKNKEGEKTVDVQWHNLVAWGKTAEMMHAFGKKGKEVAINGKLNHRSFEDEQGTKRYFTEVVVQEFLLLK